MKKTIRKVFSTILITQIILGIMPVLSEANTEINSKYSIDQENKYIFGVKQQTTKEEIIEGITSNVKYNIITKEGQEVQEEKIGTGMKVKFETNEAYEIVVKGDINGDGKISTTDLTKVKKHIIQKDLLEGCYEKAIDINEDGKISVTDLAKMKKVLVNLDTLYDTLASKVKIGDYVEYNPTESTYTIEGKYTGHSDNQTISTDDLKWRVFKVENDQVILISEKVTTSTLKLSGIEGYNNAVYILNDMSNKLYSKEGISESVRCLNFEDVKPVLSNEFWNTADKWTYERTISKNTTKIYPNIALQDAQVTINGNTGTLGYSEQNELVTGGQSYTNVSFVSNYVYCNTASTNYYIDPIYYDLFSGSFYLSTRTMDMSNGFRIYMMWENAIAPATLYKWSASAQNLNYGYHPVVTLKQNVDTTKGTGTIEDPFII